LKAVGKKFRLENRPGLRLPWAMAKVAGAPELSRYAAPTWRAVDARPSRRVVRVYPRGVSTPLPED
jgi:hypothetical protein